jgi:hypothetical protein
MHNSFIVFAFLVHLFSYPDQSLICAMYLKPQIWLPLVSYPIYCYFFILLSFVTCGVFLDYLSTLAWLNPCILIVGLFSIPLGICE